MTTVRLVERHAALRRLRVRRQPLAPGQHERAAPAKLSV
jgi:hypothetical protein